MTSHLQALFEREMAATRGWLPGMFALYAHGDDRTYCHLDVEDAWREFSSAPQRLAEPREGGGCGRKIAMASAYDHARTSPEGFECGAQLVRLAEPVIARLAEEGEPDERCRTCAFRPGTVPNGCAQTMADAIKCIVEGVPFLCHQADRKGQPCHGWFAARVAIRCAEEKSGQRLNVQVPWEFSAPDEDFDKVEAARAKRERKAQKRVKHLNRLEGNA